MASSSRGSRGRGQRVTNESFGEWSRNGRDSNVELPQMTTPLGSAASNRNVAVASNQNTECSEWDDNAQINGQGDVEEVVPRNSGLDYTLQYIEEERQKISKIKLAGGVKKDEHGSDNRRGRGRGGQFSRGRGRGANDGGRGFRRPARGSARSERTRSAYDQSIYGTIPDGPLDDTDVYLKYDFTRRVYDTSGLVINRVREKIMTKLATHQVMTIEGFTGCGKTTQVPQFILDDAERNKRACRIAVTQPRRIAAISVANRVASERGWKLGGIVGYQVGMDKRVTEDTRLSYMTTGVLLQLLISKKNLDGWTHIVIDEVHERDLETDLLLLVIKKIMVDTANDTTRIILMSATLNPEKFNLYFPLWETEEFSGQTFNVKVDLPNQYPVEELYLEQAAAAAGYENYSMDNFEEPKIYMECYEMAVKIIESLDAKDEMENGNGRTPTGSRGAVLVFLPGLLEIETLFKILNEVNDVRKQKPLSENRPKWTILPLHSTITNDEQQRVFHPAKLGFRKIILATNIAESSITVPDIKYVIDFCLTKNLSCDPSTNYTCLRLEWASKNQCIQRRGRCGRVAPGILYRMVSRKFYDTLEQEAQPEMLRSSLESVVLQVKLLDMGPPKSVLALAVDPPEENNIQRAVSNLKEIGALTINIGDDYDAYDGSLTFVGRVLTRLPIDIRLGRLILLGHAFDCLEETVIIAAGLSVKSPFAYPYHKRLEAYLSKINWAAKTFSDCIALLTLYQSWFNRHEMKQFSAFQDEKRWAKTYYVQLSSLREMKVLVDELYKRLRLCGIDLMPSVKSGEQQILLLKLVIAGGFYPNYFTRTRPNARDYQKEINREVAGKNPFASVVFQGFPMEQPGDLYKKIIGKYSSYHTCIPHVEFHGSRVVVTFDSRGSTIGPISQGVYRAVKLRQLRHNLTFGTPSRDKAYTLLNTSKAQMEARPFDEAPMREEMPGLLTDKIKVIVTYIDSPTEFFVIMQKSEMNALRISKNLEQSQREFTPLTKEFCQVGQFVVTIQQGKYLRARIDAERNGCEQVLLFLLDVGLSRWSQRTNVYTMSRAFLESGIQMIPALAIPCRLRELRPALRTDCVWSPEALVMFEQYCHQNKCQMVLEIHAVAEGCISGVLKNPRDLEGQSINELLVEKGYAEYCPEPEAFRDNYMMRERVKMQTPTLAANSNVFELRQNKRDKPERLLESPKFIQEEPEQVVSLRGPHSPLEMTFTALCGSAHLKQVVTDGSSVNSVTLDQDPTNPSARLMIAANVSIAQRSGNILARETTVMPPIPGLTGLLAMLFCPKVEFRLDDDKTCYTGCLTGLGIDPDTKDSVYSDHDMEVVFDTVIDRQDINMINSIRSGMNAILCDNIRHDGIRNLRDKMRKEAVSLLTRHRESMEEIWPMETHKWGVTEEQPGPSTKRHKARDAGVVFPLHVAPVLNEKLDGTVGTGSDSRNMFVMPPSYSNYS